MRCRSRDRNAWRHLTKGISTAVLLVMPKEEVHRVEHRRSWVSPPCNRRYVNNIERLLRRRNRDVPSPIL